jgi:hypothetical protein
MLNPATSRARIEEIANAVLYEGYILYPYRASAVKNRQRWNFGVLYPRAYSESLGGTDSWSMQTECLVKAMELPVTFSLRVRFLQLINRSIDGQSSESWQEGVERDVSVRDIDLCEVVSNPIRQSFVFAGGSDRDGNVERRREQIEGVIEVQAKALRDGIFRTHVQVFNTTFLENPNCFSREQALMRSLASAHTILEIKGGEFISLLETPDEYREIAAQCKNVGTWPVLVGEQGERDTMLSSPIILYDYPQIAPESAGALFDGTEIDEILTLRIMTLSDEEKLEMKEVDERARQILERTESMTPEQLMKMHGALRELRSAEPEMP